MVKWFKFSKLWASYVLVFYYCTFVWLNVLTIDRLNKSQFDTCLPCRFFCFRLDDFHSYTHAESRVEDLPSPNAIEKYKIGFISTSTGSMGMLLIYSETSYYQKHKEYRKNFINIFIIYDPFQITQSSWNKLLNISQQKYDIIKRIWNSSN